MKMNDAIDMKGRLTLRLENATGDVVQEIAANNDIMLSGRDLVVKLFADTEGAIPISSIAVGKGTAGINIKDEKLSDEVFRKKFSTKVIGDVEDGANSRKKLTVSTELDFPEANVALTEAAIFNSLEDKKGVMYNRVTFPAVNKTPDFKLTLVWEILF